MKRFLVFLLGLCFFNSTSFSQNYQSGDSLYVWAVSGLNMRATPDLKGEKIVTIPYGEKVKVEQFYGKGIALQIIQSQQLYEQNYSGFKMAGQWSKISFMDSVGYVFNGYLSKLPIIEIETKENREGQKITYPKEGIGKWAERNFGLLKETEEINLNQERQEKFRIYGNGITITEISHKCYDEIITFPNISYNEAFLLLNIFWRLDSQSKEIDGFRIKEQTENSFHGDDLEMCDFTLKYEFGIAIITTGCCC